MFLVGPSDNVLAVFEELKPMFHNIGLDIQDTKCEIYNPSSVEIESHTSIPITTEGISILGIPVGKEDFMSQACVTIENMEKLYAINYSLQELKKLFYC